MSTVASAASLPEERPAGATVDSSGGGSGTGGGFGGGRIARNILTGYVAQALIISAAFFTTPVLIRMLGKDQFGLWSMMQSIAGYLGLFEMGLSMTIAKRVAECLAHNDRDRLRRVLGTAFALYMTLTCIVWLVVILLTFGIARIFPNLPPASIPTARTCLLIIGLYQSTMFFFMPQSAILYGAGRIDLWQGFAALITTAMALVNVFLVWHKFGPDALACSLLGSALVTGITLRALARKTVPWAGVNPLCSTREMARELSKFGSRVMLISVAGTVAYNSDTLIVARVLTLRDVATYAIAVKIANLVYQLAMKPVNVLMPAYADAQARKDTDRLFRLFVRSICTAMIICMPFTISMWAFGDRVITSWAGFNNWMSWPIAMVLTLMYLVQLPGHACFIITTGTERNLFFVRVYVVAALTNLVLSYSLTRQLGAVGPAIGSLITVTVVDFSILPISVCRQFGFSYRGLVGRCLRSLLVPSLAGSGLALLLRVAPLPEKKFVAIAMLAAVVATCWGTWLRFGVDSETRAQYLGKVRAKLRRSA